MDSAIREVVLFGSGAICMGYCVAGAFFLKFWRRTKDTFFLWFAASFFILAAVRVALSSTAQSEVRSFLYLGRAMAVLLIVVAIIQKNRPKKLNPSAAEP